MRVLIPLQILAGAWHLSFRQWRDWFDLAIIPLIWSMLIGLFLQPNYAGIMGLNPADPAARSAVTGIMGTALLFIATSIVVWSMFAAAWLRFCLGLPSSSGAPTGLSFEARARGVAVAFIKISLILTGITMIAFVALGASAPTFGALNPLPFVALLAGAPLLTRLGMMLPAAASGADASLGAAWRLTRGNVLRLIFAIGAAVVGTFIVSVILGSVVDAILMGVFGKTPSLGPRVVGSLIGNLISFATTAFILATIALSYRQLSGPSLQVVTPDPS